MILTNDRKGEVMIDIETGRMFRRELTESEVEEIAEVLEKERMDALFNQYCKIVRGHTDAQEAFNELESEGFTIMEMLDCALRFKG